MDIMQYIRSVSDFPKPGILFRDIAPLLADPTALQAVITQMAVMAEGQQIDKITGLDARGFIFGPLLALRLGVPFVMVRKAGKLPGETVSTSYDLEYGEAAIEIQSGAVSPGERVLLIDDLLATGGTLAAAAALVARCGAVVAGYLVLIELEGLGGRERLAPHPVMSLVTYAS